MQERCSNMEVTNMHTWDDDQIREFYDQNPDLSLSTYSGMLGLSGGELKEILMTDGNVYDKQEAETAEEMFPPQTEARTTRNYW